jgi:hypothetical protein
MRDWIEKVRIALGNRRYAYRSVFKGPNADIVLKDLMRFCRMHESTFHPDPRAHALAEGRREVILRICHHLQLSPEELWALYSGMPKED